ncbi:LysR family transcriptional regulator [Piscinibacter defluvii]|uniref:LysR family transcriptional regulator n=1 Tax=Piscinibacter defluvii TaxID=1796922 RepID=UPI000FDDCA4F|nr:LysR family transcriptional regulator [Piscinibacter defluvii]
MSRFDHLDLDGHALELLLAVHEEGSVTRAAQRLGVTQSAVSHGLDKLRAIAGDALFVRSGRGIVATVQAEALAARARVLLDELRAFGQAAGFDPARWRGTLTIAANDLQRDLLLPALLRRLRAASAGARLCVIPSGAPQPALLREQGCDLVITPRPPEAADLLQKRLFEDRYVVWFDAAARKAPARRADYLAAEHVTVRHEDRRGLDIDAWLAEQRIEREIVATVPGFAGIAALLRGGPWLATLPSLLGRGALRGLAATELPFATPPMPMYLVWHRRRQDDPLHRWLRAELEAVAREAMEGGPPPG